MQDSYIQACLFSQRERSLYLIDVCQMSVKKPQTHIMAVTPISVLIKFLEKLEKKSGSVNPNRLFDIVLNLASKHEIYLYDFYMDYEGNIASSDFWRDISRMVTWGYAKKASDDIRLTKDGKEFANWLRLEEPLREKFERILQS